jgi:methylenetetrahydrofolate dehydrogenase (NADP+) / methenyltetrahydrofolate cyclohydrolase / formyltetrahydrofolate synthetase
LVAACEGESQFKFLYDLDLSIEEKITIIAKDIYRADGIELSDLAKKQIETYTRQGYGNLPSSFLRPVDLRHIRRVDHG